MVDPTVVTVLDQAGVGIGVGASVGLGEAEADGPGDADAEGSGETDGDAEGTTDGDAEGDGEATRAATAGAGAPNDQLFAGAGNTTARAGVAASARVSTASRPDRARRAGRRAFALWSSRSIDMLRVWLVRPATGNDPNGHSRRDAGTSMAPPAVPCM